VYGDAADAPEALGECVAAALKSAGVSGAEIWTVSADLTPDQETALTEVIGQAGRIRPAQVLGDTGAASAALQLAAVLSHAESDDDARGRLALIASVDRDGLVGAAVLRIPETAAPGV
jgi:3-oxoacyl-[acyl-carrier-protein] synthase II